MKNDTVPFLKKLKRIFDIKLFPMDLGRLVCIICIPLFRVKRVNEKGEKYRTDFHGGAVLAPNHTSYLDPFAVGSCFWYRRVFFLAAEAAMKPAFKAFLLRGMGCIKVDRNISDIEAIHKVKKVLEGGHTVTVFPQGKLKDASVGVGKLKGGAVLMALQAKAPIVPMYSEKNRHLFERRLFVIGEPIDPSLYVKGRFPSMDDIEKVTDVLEESMVKCRETYFRLKNYDNRKDK